LAWGVWVLKPWLSTDVAFSLDSVGCPPWRHPIALWLVMLDGFDGVIALRPHR